ncbi:hypothetical protein [Actinomadura rudentiformis]|uniref:Uncharacterized protein n=1 Tax=Actinomadura rudentiformis TaxID=359158 RepID=A0A6H9YL34_9ACTN|nr:hypothetical protein [Actinomadura rudentiformis]KAB2341867.1 hypothetical protein F8566_40530 [Actinomadura rudentiformis]
MTNHPTPNDILPSETVKIILAVLDGIAIPHAATVEHDETRTKILLDRVMHVTVMLESLLGSGCPNIDDAVSYLEEKLAEHQPVGYVSQKAARRRIEAGATWSEAVSLDYREGAGR